MNPRAFAGRTVLTGLAKDLATLPDFAARPQELRRRDARVP